MRLNDLVVVLDGSARDDARLAIAVALARRHGAHLSGFCPLDVLFPISPIFTASGYGGILASQELGARLEADAWTRADEIEARFRETLRRNDLPGDWHVGAGPAGAVVAFRARTSDLLVLGQLDPDHKLPPACRDIVEQALTKAGRPILMIPHAGQFDSIGEKQVLIGWNGTREAARAAHDALPLIGPSAAVTVLTIERATARERSFDVPAADIAEHLARHGLDVTAARTVTDDGISEADALLSYAADTGADLLVTGGYGHSPTRELLLGGVTRELLRHMTLPVLMSH